MKNVRRQLILIGATLLLPLVGKLAVAQEALPSTQPVNVEGTWTVSAKNENGEVDTKTLEIKQNGTTLTGHFKGPNQSGGLEGTINAHHILIKTKTRWVLTFRGQVEGDTMQGNFGVRGHHGEWRAWRSSPTP